MRVTTRTFPDPRGLCPVPVTEYTLQNDHGVSVSCIDYGAIITDVRMPDREGNIESIVRSRLVELASMRAFFLKSEG